MNSRELVWVNVIEPGRMADFHPPVFFYNPRSPFTSKGSWKISNPDTPFKGLGGQEDSKPSYSFKE
jgi:hypothetical protein